MRRRMLAVAAVLALMMVGCTEGGGGSSAPSTVPVESSSSSSTSSTSTTVRKGDRVTPDLPPKPWHPDGDVAFTSIAEHLHPRSDAFIRRLVETGGINFNTGTVIPKSDGRVSGYPLNEATADDPEFTIVDGWKHIGGGTRLVWVNDGRHSAKGPLGEKVRIPRDALIQGHPMVGYSDRKMHLFRRDLNRITEIQHAEWWPNGSLRVHGIGFNDLNASSWDARGRSAAKLPLAELTLRHDDVMSGWVQRTSMGVALDAIGPEWVFPAHASDGLSKHPDAMPMGVILRLRPEAVERFAGAGPQTRAVVACLAGPGIVVVDRGGNSTVSLEPDPDWDQADLASLGGLTAEDFAVFTLESPT